MKFKELVHKMSKLISENQGKFDTDIVVEELIGGFQEDIEDVILTRDKFTDKLVIAITFRNQ